MSEEEKIEEPVVELDLQIDPHGRPVVKHEEEMTEVVPSSPEEEVVEEQSEETAQQEILTGSYEDNSYEIPLNAQFDVGTEEKPTLKTLKELYRSDAQIRQRFGEVSSRERNVEDREKKANESLVLSHQMVKGLAEAAQNKNIDEFFSQLAVFNPGTDPSELAKNFYQMLLPEVERRTQMDEEELKAEDLKRSNEFTKRALERRKEELAQTQTQEQQNSQVKLEMTQLGLQEQEVVAAAQELDKLAREGKLKPDIITQFQQASPLERTREIMKYAVGCKAQIRIDQVIQAIDPGLLKDNELFTELYGALTNPYRKAELTNEELTERAMRFLGKSPEAAKVNGTPSPAVSKGEPEEKSKTEGPRKVDINDSSTWKPITLAELMDPHFQAR